MSIAQQTKPHANAGIPEMLANVKVAQERTAASFVQVNAIVTRATGAIMEKQAEFLQHETLETLKGLGTFGVRRDPGASAAAYFAILQEAAEKAIVDMREINDLARQCAWDIFGLYAGLALQTLTPGKS